MTRKDYQAIAEKFCKVYSVGENFKMSGDEALDMLAVMLSDVMAHDNQNFDRVRFLKACKGAL